MFYKILLLAAFLVVLGMRIFLFFLLGPQLKDGQQVSFTTTLYDDPQYQFGSQRIGAMYGTFWGGLPVTLELKGKENYYYGQTLSIIGTVKKQVTKDGRAFTTIIANNVVQATGTNLFLSALKSFRDSTFTAYFDRLPTTEAQLLAGIVMGKRFSFDQTFQKDMQVGGVTHVVAASGMNVTFTIGFLFTLFSSLFRRKVAIVSSLIGVICYIFLAGLAASIVRAGIMGVGALVGQLLGRQYMPLWWLGICIYFMLLWEPQLIFDVGFQLSVFATLGLMIVRPLLTQKKILEDFTTTISAQTMTFPILFSAFGSVGILSVATNVCLLWMVAPLMVIGAVAAGVSLVSPPIASLIVWLAHPFLWLFISVVEFFGGISPVFSATTIPFSLIIGYYALVGGALVMIYQKRNKNF